MSEWKKGLTFLTPTYEESKVGDQSLRFYPVSVGLAFKLRGIGKGLMKALTVLFSSTATDVLTKDKTSTNKEGFIIREVTIEALKPDMAEYRNAQKSKAIDEAIDALLSPDSTDVIAELIMDSLREKFKPGDPRPNATEFMQSVPLPALTQLLWGVAKANKDVLGPLASKAGEISASLEQAVNEKLNRLKETPAPAPVGVSAKIQKPKQEVTVTESPSPKA